MAVAATFLAFVVLMLIFIAMPTGRFVLVVANPTNSPATLHDIISEAGGSFVDATRFDWMAVAYSDAEGFPARLMAAGAILVIDHAFAAGCTERTRT